MSPWSPFFLRYSSENSIKYMKSKIFEKERNVSQKYVLKGGTDAIFEVKDNLASGQPCVVVEVSLQ